MRRLVRWVAALAAGIALVVVLLAPVAEAQRTGGSFGGRRWGGGTTRRSAPVTRYRGGGSGVPFVVVPVGGGYGGGGGLGGGGLLTLLVIAGVVFVVVNGARRSSAALATPGPQSRVWENVDLGVVQIAVDRATREAIEGALSARHLHGHGRELRAAWLRAAITELRAHREAWQAVRVDDYRPMSPPMAEGSFRSVSADADHGAPLASEAPGLDVITVAVASHREIVDVNRSDAEAAEHVLRALAALEPHDIVAAEVVFASA